MSEIPEDIMKVAAEIAEPRHIAPRKQDLANEISRAILAERTRCNEILRAAFGKNVTVETLQALATADAIVASHSKEEAPQ